MHSTTTKVLAGLLLFASGTVTGYFGSRLLAERGRFELFHGDPRHFSEMVVRHLSDDLDLSAAQREKLRPIVLNTGDELAKIRREQEPKVHEAIDKGIAATKAILTPEQREKYTALMERLEKRRKAMDRFGPPRGGPDMGPPPGEGGFPPPPPPDFDGPPPPWDGGPPHHHWREGPPPGERHPDGRLSEPGREAPAAPDAPQSQPAPKTGP